MVTEHRCSVLFFNAWKKAAILYCGNPEAPPGLLRSRTASQGGGANACCSVPMRATLGPCQKFLGRSLDVADQKSVTGIGLHRDLRAEREG